MTLCQRLVKWLPLTFVLFFLFQTQLEEIAQEEPDYMIHTGQLQVHRAASKRMLGWRADSFTVIQIERSHIY